MVTKKETLQECRRMEEAHGHALENIMTHPRMKASEPDDSSIKKRRETQEEQRLEAGQPDVTTPRRNLSAEGRAELIKVLRKHADAFVWVLTDMTGIPRFVAEHELKTYPQVEPRVQQKRSIALDRRNVVKKEVEEWLKAGIVKRVRYPTWVANAVLVKKADGSWRICIDVKDMNKACPNDLL
ncbi:hypothetical protein Tco_1302161 [Tanacetum coccineum]